MGARGGAISRSLDRVRTGECAQLVRKRLGRLAEAEALYMRALHIREGSLGDAHPETVASRHNLAELATAMGDEMRAADIRQQILASLQEEAEDEKEAS